MLLQRLQQQLQSASPHIVIVTCCRFMQHLQRCRSLKPCTTMFIKCCVFEGVSTYCPNTPCLQGANQAAAAAKLGYPTYFVGNVGQDSYAEPLRAALQSAGVKLDYLQSVPGPSGTAVILLQSSGECSCTSCSTHPASDRSRCNKQQAASSLAMCLLAVVCTEQFIHR